MRFTECPQNLTNLPLGYHLLSYHISDQTIHNLFSHPIRVFGQGMADLCALLGTLKFYQWEFILWLLPIIISNFMQTICMCNVLSPSVHRKQLDRRAKKLISLVAVIP